MTYDYDVIIVGAGPCGSTMALYCARAGLEVFLVDKDSFPRDKVCGDALPRLCLSMLRELGLLEALNRIPHARAGLVVHWEGHVLRETGSGREGYAARRLLFDQMLFEAARHHVDAREGLRVESLLVHEGRVCGIRGHTSNGSSVEHTARVVAGADGCASVVARCGGISNTTRGHGAVATRAYYRLPDAGHDLEMHYLPICSPGYFWIFPVDTDTVNVGLLWFRRERGRNKGSARELHRQLVESESFKERFERAEPVGDLRSWYLPMPERQRAIHGDGFLLAGDAAGLIDPFVGHGIDTAMVSGRVAARVLEQVFLGSDYSTRALQPYADAIQERLGRSFSTSAHFRNQVTQPFPERRRLDLLNQYYFGGGATLTESKPVGEGETA